MTDKKVIWAETVIDRRTKTAAVRLSFRDRQVIIPSADARDLALNILRAAEAADGDAALMRWLQEKLGIEFESAANATYQVGKYR